MNLRGLKLFTSDKNTSIDIDIFKLSQSRFCYFCKKVSIKRRLKLISIKLKMSIVIDELYIPSTPYIHTHTLLRYAYDCGINKSRKQYYWTVQIADNLLRYSSTCSISTAMRSCSDPRHPAQLVLCCLSLNSMILIF